MRHEKDSESWAEATQKTPISAWWCSILISFFAVFFVFSIFLDSGYSCTKHLIIYSPSFFLVLLASFRTRSTTRVLNLWVLHGERYGCCPVWIHSTCGTFSRTHTPLRPPFGNMGKKKPLVACSSYFLSSIAFASPLAIISKSETKMRVTWEMRRTREDDEIDAV